MSLELWGVKYRPRNLSQVLGQDSGKKIILGALSTAEKPPTWLLSGGYGSGKTTTARILGKSLVCTNPLPNGECCCSCYECDAVDREESLNYREVDAPSYGNVENIRELIEDSRLSPVGAPHRVVVLDESHTLSKAAQAVLLKTFEDGVGDTIFILATTDPEKLLETIKSRCIPIRLLPVDRLSVLNHLRWVVQQENKIFEEEALELIVDYTYGHMRNTLNMAFQLSLGGSITLESTKEQLNLHLDDEIGILLLKSGEFWNDTLERIDILCQKSTPEEIWVVLKRVILRSYLCLVQPSRKNSEIIKKVAETYGLRLGNLSKLIMGDWSRFSIRFVDDLSVVLCFIREELGVNSSSNVFNDKKMGPSKAELRTSGLLRTKPPLSEDMITSIFDLTLVDEAQK